MANNPFVKYQAALSVEEFAYQNTSQPRQNWLLTYLDVFVLIFMLIISILSISDIQQQQTSEQKQQTKTEQRPAKQASQQAAKTTPKDKQVEIKDRKDQEVDNNNLENRLSQTVKAMGLQDSVHMKISQGYAQLEIQDKILFESSKALLLPAGQTILEKLSPLLNQASGLIYIEGHTDDRPIKTPQFPSNWELGAARATSVLHFLALQNLDATRLRAVTYGDTQPVADNDTAEGREKNRRVNIVIKISDRVD